MTNLITLQTIFIKDDVSIRLNKLDNHLKQIQCLLLDSNNNNNDVVKSLISFPDRSPKLTLRSVG
ncbi:MAG: hypothetical protein HEQ27_06310 [Dolichospermum sp. JUN01]|jgi:hypothetical protein|nr:hypothetical protein [Dolichospermum sp. JUN01]